MNTTIPSSERSYRLDEWGPISFAVFLIIVGAFWLRYPTIWSEIGRFVSDLRAVEFNGVPVFLEPGGNHTFLYGVTAEFLGILSLWLFSLTAIRYSQHSHQRLVSKTLTRAVFLLGLAFFSWQLQIGALAFRGIVPLVIVLVGATLIIRGLWNIFLTK